MRHCRPKLVLLLLQLVCGALVVAAMDLPSVVITYDGELTEFPRYMSGDRYVVEIPKTNHSRLMRGDFSTCGSSESSTIWSFPSPEGTQAILRNTPGRIEIERSPRPPAVIPPGALPLPVGGAATGDRNSFPETIGPESTSAIACAGESRRSDEVAEIP